jgi:N-acetylglucosamine-6-phosphate deacetylase
VKLALVGGKVITPEKTFLDCVVVIENGVITAIDDINKIALPDETEMIDVSGYTVKVGQDAIVTVLDSRQEIKLKIVNGKIVN